MSLEVIFYVARELKKRDYITLTAANLLLAINSSGKYVGSVHKHQQRDNRV